MKRAEYNATSFEASLIAMIESLPLEGILLDDKMRVIRGNKRWVKLLGKGESSQSLSYEKDYSFLRPLIDKVHEASLQEEEVLCSLKVPIKERRLTINFKSTPWHYPDQSIGGALIIATDVAQISSFKDKDQHKDKDKELKKLAENMALNSEASAIGIWSWQDVNEDRQEWSSQFKELLGLSHVEVEGSAKNFVNSIHPADREKFSTLRLEHFKGQAEFDLECRMKRSRGDYRWFRVTGQVSRSSTGEPLAMIGSLQDIEDIVVTALELKRLRGDIDQFAYVISHDLREPLRGMRNFARFLYEDYSQSLESEGKEYIERIESLGTRLENYLDSLLYFSRQGREQVTEVRTDLTQLAKEVRDKCLLDTGKILQLSFKTTLPEIICDPEKVKSILSNLFDNALTYNLNDIKKVELSYEKRPDGLHQFWVHDNGVGIKKENWDRAFTIFKKCDEGDDLGAPEGDGLGLALVKKLVVRLDGQVWIESSDKKSGTTFTFTMR